MAGLSGSRHVLVLNPGSSSLKVSVIREPGDSTLARREIEWGVEDVRTDARRAALEALIHELGAAGGLDLVGYRVVHGGLRFREPTLIDDAVVDAIAELDALAPLHNRVAVETIRAARRLLPDLRHVACFDTAFHASLPEAAWRYALPDDWVQRWGIRRFGFHGLSVAWSVERAAAELRRPADELQLVVAHLGSGCSVTAVAGGKSAWTSMGLTPLEGLVMGSRSGSVDPGIFFHLIAQGIPADALADGLEHRSGLLALSARTASVRELEEVRDSDERAALALDVFARSAAGFIGYAATSLDRIDAIVFTGGIGEHSASIRDSVLARLSPLGGGTQPPVLTVEAREDIVIARQAANAIEVVPGGTRNEEHRL